MVVLKILLLQSFWFFAVYSHHYYWSWILWPLSLFLILINYKLFKPISIGKGIFLLCLFIIWGIVQDNILTSFNIISTENSLIWLNSLWVIFFAYYGDILNKFKKFNTYLLGIIGAIGGLFSYFGGCRLADIQINNIEAFMLVVGFSWGFFFPVSIKLFYNNSWWNRLLDKTVLFSFDKCGFLRHSKEFKDDFNDLGSKKTILVTGGTGGIGRNVVESLIKFNQSVYFTGRNESLGEEVANLGSHFFKLDMIDWKLIDSFCDNCPSFDSVILNAGGMPDSLEHNEFGVETQAASQLFGHFYLIDSLRKKGKLNQGCSIVWVSSGGMYLKQLDLTNLISPSPYDKVDTYANVKRAQVTFVEELAKSNEWKDFKVTSMHPGWVATPGIKEALPGFYKFTENRLRSTSEGADTILWLSLTKLEIESGKFYFDRKVVSPYISKKYIPNSGDRKKLVELIKKYQIS